MLSYFANFIKTTNPNGANLPVWPPANSGDDVKVMNIDVESGANSEQLRARYLLLDKLQSKK